MEATTYRLGKERYSERTAATKPLSGTSASHTLDEGEADAAGYVRQLWCRHAALATTDVLALLISTTVATFAAHLVLGDFLEVFAYRLGGAAIFLATLSYAVAGLYNSLRPSPAEEVRIQALTTTAVFGSLTLGAILLLDQAHLLPVYLGSAWLLSLLAVPLGRALLHHLCAHRSWWLCPVVVLSTGTVGHRIVRTLANQPELGLRPVALLVDDAERHGETVEEVPVVGSLAQATYFSQAGVPYAVAVLPPAEKPSMQQLEYCTSGFRGVLIVPDSFFGLQSRWVRAREVGGVVGLEMRHRLRSRWRRSLKRVFDASAALVVLAALLPFALLAAAFIKLDSRGPVFYRQHRLGQGGRIFHVFKFRSMYVGADKRLQEVLENDASARAEYERYQKLDDDPRVTPVGRYLRRTSLDELPQLLNVLRGEMSLVGPRAYLPSERPKMKDKDHVILRSLPGITGIWQVSGRSDLSFETRVDLDANYVRNWSLSFDLYLLARTVPVVLLGKGAK